MHPTECVRIPAEMTVYAERHDVIHTVQSLVSSLLIDRPDDPISYLISALKRNTDAPKVILLGPPAVGKTTVARALCAELNAVHVTADSLLQGREQQVPEELLVGRVRHRLSEVDCCNRGWVLVGVPQTRLQVLGLQQAGVLPQHVVMLEAPDDVLSQRSQGRLMDPLTGDIYHQTFVCPPNSLVAQRLERGRSSSEERWRSELQRYHLEVSGLMSACQPILKVISSDQPHTDVYQQVLAFVQTRHRSFTPRVLLLGPPGSGKSLQARLLSEKYKMVDVCFSQLLMSVAADGSSLGEAVGPYLEGGCAVPDSLVLRALEERLSRLDCSSRGWILHDFPPNLKQAMMLRESAYQPNSVFFLEATDEVCVERMSLRATDPVTGQRFHAVTRPAPSSEVQSRLKTRPEDETHSVTLRLEKYRTHTAALQSVYPGAVHVDADQDPRSVFEAVESRLSSRK